MRVLDLLEMLRDISKNETVWGYLDGEPYSLSGTEFVDGKVNINLSKNKNSLKNWELSLMINKKELLYLPIFIKLDKKNHQVFGFQLDDQKIILH